MLTLTDTKTTSTGVVVLTTNQREPTRRDQPPASRNDCTFCDEVSWRYSAEDGRSKATQGARMGALLH
jgi:hypothetical protein